VAAGLIQVRRAGGLGEIGRPVAGGIECIIHLPAGGAGDTGLAAVERPPPHLGQAVQIVVGVIFIETAADDRGAHHIRLPQAVGVLIVAVLVAVKVGHG